MKSLVHSSISSRTVPRVPLRQPLRFPCRYSAPCALRKLLRTVASAVRGSHQVCAAESGQCLLTTILPKGYRVWFVRKKENLPYVGAVAHLPSFVAPSIVYVNTSKGAQLMNKPGNQKWSPAYFQGSRKFPHYAVQEPQLEVAVVL